MSSRRCHVGEHWNRGRDMRDGKLTPETAINILCDINRFELLTVRNEIKQLSNWAYADSKTWKKLYDK